MDHWNEPLSVKVVQHNKSFIMGCKHHFELTNLELESKCKTLKWKLSTMELGDPKTNYSCMDFSSVKFGAYDICKSIV